MKTISQILTELGVTENTTVDELIDLLTLVTVNEKNGIKSISVKPLPNVMRNKADELKDRLTNITIDENYGMSAVLDKRIALLYILLKTLNDNKAELNDDEQTIVANILKANQVTGVENGSGVINFTNGKITATVSKEINIGKTNKGKIQVSDDIKFIVDGSTEIAKADDEGFHAGDFVIAYDYIKSENASFYIDTHDGDTYAYFDDDEIILRSINEKIDIHDKKIEMNVSDRQKLELIEGYDEEDDEVYSGVLQASIVDWDMGKSEFYQDYIRASWKFYGTDYETYNMVEINSNGVYVNNQILATKAYLDNEIATEAATRQSRDNQLQNYIEKIINGQAIAYYAQYAFCDRNGSPIETTYSKVADIVDNLTSTSTNKPLSANQGKVLKDALDTINALLTSDDTDLDTIQEIVTYIKSNKSIIETLSSNKVNVSDIIDNLTSQIANKPLSAKQGYLLKGMIDSSDDEITKIKNGTTVVAEATKATTDSEGNNIANTYMNRTDALSVAMIEVGDYNESTGEITLTYNTNGVSSIDYNSSTGVITFTY